MFAPSSGLVLNCGYARTAIYQLFAVNKKTKNAASSSSKDDQQTAACGDGKNAKGGNVRVDNSTSTVGICVPRSEHGDTVSMQEGECTTTQQDNHEHTNATNASMPELSKKPLEIFEENFQLCNAGLPADYFLRKGKHPSTFENYGVQSILAAFNAKWYPKQARQEYITTFSLEKWKALPDPVKKSHSISKCVACSIEHSSLQTAMPLKPLFVYNVPTQSNFEKQGNSVDKLTGKQFVQQHYKQFDSYCLASTGKPFSEIALNNVSDIKKGLNQAKQDTMRKCRDESNQALSENALIRVHSQNVSFALNDRLQKNTYYNPPVPPKPRKRKPLTREQCDRFDELCEVLENWEPGKKFVAAEVAREFGVSLTDASNKIKLLAMELGVDIPELTIGSKPKSTKKKFQGTRITMPVPPSSKKLKKQESELLESGAISVGEPCAPVTLSRYRKGVEVETIVTGRKFPLLEIRKKFLQKHEALMRLHTDDDINKMERDEICEILSKCNSYNPAHYATATMEELQQKLKQVERTRTLWMWHDHSTVLSFGLVLVLVGVTYDPLTFYTDGELAHHSQNDRMSLQELVEQGDVHIFAHCSSTSSDQASLIPERVACLESLSVPIVTTKGIPINDKLMFFKGDKQAAWFEAGISRGGNYCCVSCTCHRAKFSDMTHVHSCEERLFLDTQAIALSGKYGKEPNRLNFYEGLNTDELRQELVARQIYDIPGSKQGRLQMLKDTLCGVQRVPSLLLLDPTVDPKSSEYNLADYCVLPFEPLHDLKGHLSKICQI